MKLSKRIGIISVSAAAITSGVLISQKEKYPHYIVEQQASGRYTVYEAKDGKKGKVFGYDLDDGQAAYFRK